MKHYLRYQTYGHRKEYISYEENLFRNRCIITHNIEMDGNDYSGCIKIDIRTSKMFSSSVWLSCESLFGVCESRNSVEQKGGESMIIGFKAYRENRRFMKYFFRNRARGV